MLERTEGKKYHYNTCAFQSKQTGRLQGLAKIQKVCMCPQWVVHEALIGKRRLLLQLSTLGSLLN